MRHGFRFLIVAALVLAACSATDMRIQQNEELFNSYPPDVQAMIKTNRIAEGFDRTQVYMSWGNADTTESDEGAEKWIYTQVRSKSVTTKKDVHKYALERKEFEEARDRGEYVEEPSTEEIVRLYRTRVQAVVVFVSGRVSSWSEPGDEWLDDWHQ